jgi:hypothetical protein
MPTSATAPASDLSWPVPFGTSSGPTCPVALFNAGTGDAALASDANLRKTRSTSASSHVTCDAPLVNPMPDRRHVGAYLLLRAHKRGECCVVERMAAHDARIQRVELGPHLEQAHEALERGEVERGFARRGGLLGCSVRSKHERAAGVVWRTWNNRRRSSRPELTLRRRHMASTSSNSSLPSGVPALGLELSPGLGVSVAQRRQPGDAFAPSAAAQCWRAQTCSRSAAPPSPWSRLLRSAACWRSVVSQRMSTSEVGAMRCSAL